jgi:hypothetical protein
MAELRPVAEADEADRNEAELAAVLDLLWRKLHGIHGSWPGSSQSRASSSFASTRRRSGRA